MEEINGIPLVFDAKQDDAFLGNLFPNGLSFSGFKPVENNPWKEEWKLKSPEEIQKYYFPEAIVTQKNSIALCDTTGVFKNVKIQESKPECPCEKDENGNCNCEEVKVDLPEALVENFIHSRKILTISDEITIWFFSSSDGAKLLRAQKDFKESSSRYPDVLAVFMETDDSFNVFGTVMDFVIGANVKSFFKGDTHWERVLDFMEKNEIHVSKKDAKKLFDNALSHYGFFQYVRDLFSVVKGKAVAVVLEGIAEASDKIANGIADWKFKEEYWDTSLPGFSHKNAPFIILSGNKHGVVINQKVRSKTKNEILAKAKKMKSELEQSEDKIPRFIYKPLQKLILMATDETYRFYEVMQSFYKEFVSIVEAGQEWMNAFLCGFINGFLDFISGIFSFIGFFLKAVKNYADYKQNETFYHAIVLEYAENFIQAMASFDCIAFFKQVLSLPLEMLSKFIALAKSINITFNGSKIAYFTGYIIFAIVQILLEIIFTGGSATVERLFAKAGSSVKNVLKKAGNLADDVFEALTHLIDQIKKGANNFAAYVKKIIDDFFKWLEDLFKSGKADEVFEFVGSGGNLKYLKILSRNMVAQEHSMSCAAACIRQLAKDQGIEITEEAVRKLAGTTRQMGTTDYGMLMALEDIFKDNTVEALSYFRNSDELIPKILNDISKEGSWLTSIHPRNGQKHAVIVDKILNKKVFIRDPWPIEGIGKGSGVVAIVDLDDFIYSWLKAGANKYKVK